MYADLDQLVLSGKIFEGGSRPTSPARTPSPDNIRNWPDVDEKGDYNSDEERRAAVEKTLAAQQPQQSIGMGPGRTGVKGVIRDQAEARSMEREKRKREVQELNSRMERANLGGKTYLEEEREQEWERIMLEGLDPSTLGLNGTIQRPHKFGHLREVGVKGFLPAVEKESKGVWVVVHIYDPSLDRCFELDHALSILARRNLQTKFLRARASALGFASLSSPQAFGVTRPPMPGNFNDEEEETEEDLEESQFDDDVDLDVLPTMLVYRDGELVHNWVRVDWEAGTQGIEGLLSKYQILQSTGAGAGNCGLPSDDDDDLLDSDADD